jgi:hypothetical protein
VVINNRIRYPEVITRAVLNVSSQPWFSEESKDQPISFNLFSSTKEIEVGFRVTYIYKPY